MNDLDRRSLERFRRRSTDLAHLTDRQALTTVRFAATRVDQAAIDMAANYRASLRAAGAVVKRRLPRSP